MRFVFGFILTTALISSVAYGCFTGRRRRRRSPPPAVNGGYTQWSSWSACSKSCATGWKSRTRTCTNPRPANGGVDCSRYGPPAESVKCNTQRCPVNGGYTSWSAWSACSRTCGDGERVRQRSCQNPPPSNGGADCQKLGPSVEKEKCILATCADPDHRPCLYQLCSSNAKNEIRGCDKHGCGHFGAPRDSATNDGIDIICQPGSDVFAPFVGRILQAIRPEPNKEYAYNNGLLVHGLQDYRAYQAKIFYMTPSRESGTMEAGDKIGTSVAQPHEHMIQHVHLKVYKDGVIIDPTSWPVCEM